MNIEYPMLFELRSHSADKTTHCGVLEFTADEGTVSLPNWVYMFSFHSDSLTKTPEVIPFSDSGRRLDGKPATQSVEPSSTPILKQQQQQTENKTKSSSGKLVFGSKGNAANVSLKYESQESPKKKTKTKEFQAFTGKKYSLIG
ncbi:unnamed protein product [Lathyrus oleraceus]